MTPTVRRQWLIPIVCGTLFVVLVAANLVWQVVSIQRRLSTNRAIADQLVGSLCARFPNLTFGGAASYEREVVYITVVENPDEATRRDIELWLRKLKAELKISPKIALRFPDSRDTNDAIEF